MSISSDVPLGPAERSWLSRWLSAHKQGEPEVEASYVYLGMARDWSNGPPNGRISPEAVIGAGSGIGFGEPPGAIESTVGTIWRGSIDALRREE